MAKRELDVATDLGCKPIKGADHRQPYPHYALTPGVAWQINDDTGDHILVEVPKSFAVKCEQTWDMRWIQGRTVTEFMGPDGKIYAQPTQPDASRRSVRAKSAGFREAPGVAPPSAGEPEPPRKRRA